MTSLSDDQIKYVKYKWEFLRRNPEFIDDCINLNIEDTKDLKDFCKKWGVWWPVPYPPNKSYDDILRDNKNFSNLEDIDLTDTEYVLDNTPFNMERIIFNEFYPEFLPNRSLTIVDGWDYDRDDDIGLFFRYISDHLSKTGELTIKINLNYSKKRLIDDFKTLIDRWKNLYEDAYKKQLYREYCKEQKISSSTVDENIRNEFEKFYKRTLKKRNHKYSKKYHFENFDDYLKVYDLRQEGMSWAKIKNTLKLNSVQTARNHYNAACELIKKGIDLYVK